MKTKLEYLIKVLWQNKIVRANPTYATDTENYEKVAITKESVEKFIVTLYAIVDHCISRILYYGGAVSINRKQTRV